MVNIKMLEKSINFEHKTNNNKIFSKKKQSDAKIALIKKFTKTNRYRK